MTRKKRGLAPNVNLHTAQPSDPPATASTSAAMEAFSFGNPVAVLDRRELLGYIECQRVGEWFEPPMPWDGLARTFRAAVHNSSPIYVKRNILVSTFIPHKLLSRTAFARWVQNFLVFDNGYLERRDNPLGRPLALELALAKYMRRGTDLEWYFFVQNRQDKHEFKPGSIFHLMELDINREVYGLPEYLSALNAIWLNESATLFRRRYYKNGSHAGFILYMTDAAQKQEDVDNLREALKISKGPGNFRNHVRAQRQEGGHPADPGV